MDLSFTDIPDSLAFKSLIVTAYSTADRKKAFRYVFDKVKTLTNLPVNLKIRD